MARQIIVLKRTRFSPNIEYEVAFWLATPSGRETFLANAQATSRVKNATAPELAALQAGTVVERVNKIPVPEGTGLAAMQAILVAMHGQLQTAWTNDTTYDRYNSSWDGSTWSMQSNP